MVWLVKYQTSKRPAIQPLPEPQRPIRPFCRRSIPWGPHCPRYLHGCLVETKRLRRCKGSGASWTLWWKQSWSMERCHYHGKRPDSPRFHCFVGSWWLYRLSLNCIYTVYIYIKHPQNSRFSMEFFHIWHNPVEVLNLRCMGFFPKFHGEFRPLLPIICRASLWKTPPSRSFMEATADDVWFVANETNWHRGASIQIVRYV